MIKIIVDSEELKQEILAESEYIHNFLEIIKPGISLKTKWIGLDSDKAGSLMHETIKFTLDKSKLSF